MNTSKFHKTGYTLTALIGAALALGLSAQAGATDLVGPDVTVQYKGISVETEQGAAQLLKRIEGAAVRVCGRLDHGSLASRANAESCAQKLIVDAVRRVNHPMLQAVYDAGGRVSPAVASLTK